MPTRAVVFRGPETMITTREKHHEHSLTYQSDKEKTQQTSLISYMKKPYYFKMVLKKMTF